MGVPPRRVAHAANSYVCVSAVGGEASWQPRTSNESRRLGHAVSQDSQLEDAAVGRTGRKKEPVVAVRVVLRLLICW